MMGDETYFPFFPVQVESKNSATSSAIHSVFKNALQLLQEKGLVFQKDGGFDKPYYVRDLQLKFPFVASITDTFMLRNTYLLVSKIITRRHVSRSDVSSSLFQSNSPYPWLCEILLLRSPDWPRLALNS